MAPNPGTAQWLILTMERAFGVFDLCTAVENAGYAYRCASELPIARDELIPDDSCVVINGPAARVAELCRKRRWIPGGWCDPEIFACHSYYEHWHRHIVQRQFAFLSLSMLASQQSNIFEQFEERGQVFIRPDGFDKCFDGGLVGREDFDLWLKRTRAGETSESTKCVVARPLTIENEWRLLVRDRKVITGSSYRISGRVVKTQPPPINVIQFAETVATEPYPGLPNIYVLDVASVGDKLGVMEVGSVNACGYYGCDMGIVIPAISTEAENAWRSSSRGAAPSPPIDGQ